MSKFKFTDEQQQIVNYILEQVRLGPKGGNVLISGRGGVGKTTMVCHLIGTLLEMNYRVACGAMTGKATGVLRQKIYSNLEESGLLDKDTLSNLTVETINKLTRRAIVAGIDANGQTIYVNKWIDPKDFHYDVLIVDELSMVPHFIQQWWSRTDCRIVGLGDYCQIPEVHTEDTAREIAGFRHDLKLPPKKLINGYGIKALKEVATFELKEVLRSTGDITKLCNDLRNFSKSKVSIIQTIKDWAKQSDVIHYTNDLNDLELGIDWQIIAYTNRMCETINNKLAIGTDFPDLKDKVILHDNINPANVYNGEVYIFQELLDRINEYNEGKEDRISIIWKFNGKMPRKNAPSLIERGSYQTWISYKHKASRVHEDRFNKMKEIIQKREQLSQRDKEDYLNGIADIAEKAQNSEIAFNTVVNRMSAFDVDTANAIVAGVPPLPRVFFVNFGMGYACTTHKSQGSEYDKVCYILEKMDRPLLYTGCSRAKKELKVIDLT